MWSNPRSVTLLSYDLRAHNFQTTNGNYNLQSAYDKTHEGHISYHNTFFISCIAFTNAANLVELSRYTFEFMILKKISQKNVINFIG